MPRDLSAIKIIATNRQASHEYHLLDKYEAGIVLKGTEVKSLRMGKANLNDGWVAFEGGEAFLCDVHISPYTHGNVFNHMEKRQRKLLLNRAELAKIESRISEKGLSLIPLKIYFKGGIAKVEVAIAKGKKLHDKREATKTKEAERAVARALGRGRQ